MKKALPLLCLIIICSCKQNTSELESNYIQEKINNFDNLKDKDWVVILPGLGCKGCIQEGEAFIAKHINKKNVLFFLTRVESIKLLQNKLSLTLADHDNIYIDRTGYFDLPTDNGIYPIIIELRNDKILRHEFQSPENGMAFNRLEELLEN